MGAQASGAELNLPAALTIAVGDHGCTRALLNGAVKPPGVELEFVEVRPMIDAYRRMIRTLEFDICEMAPTTYLIAREAGIPITALPIFLMRRFEHSAISCRPGSRIRGPRDLEGREVGVRAYSVTTGVWVRAFLQHQYEVDLNTITWVVDDDEHVETLKLPANVRRLPHAESIAQLFAAGSIDAALGGNAGIGRSGSPTGMWEERRGEPASADRLFADPDHEARDWYRLTGAYPLHAVLCVKLSAIDAHPNLVGALFEAFDASKLAFMTALETEPARSTAQDVQHARRMRGIVHGDPLPFGLEQNRPSIDALIRYSIEQGLISAHPEPTELFLEPYSRQISY